MNLSVTGALFCCFVSTLLAQPGSSNFEALSQKAEAAIDDHPEQAVALYRQALDLRPTWAEGWLYMGATLLRLGRFAESRDALQTGASLQPGKGTAWAYLGMAEYELGNYPQALSDILKGESIGLADRPAFVAAVRYRAALTELRLGDHAQALEQLRPLVRAGNDSPPVVEALGISALFLNSPSGSLTATQRALVEAAGRAAWAFLAERSDSAANLFQKLVSQFPAEPGVQYMYGVFLLDHDPAAAEAAFRKELATTSSHALARVQLALLFLQRGEAEAALEYAKEASKLQPSSALCQVTLGRALLGAGRTPEAISALEKGRDLAPDSSRTHFYLQQAYGRAGRTADAKREKAEFDRLRAQQEPVTLGEH